MARTSGKKLLLLLASSLLISNCAALDTLESRRQAAHDIAATNHLQAQTITTPLFTFTTFQKITNTNAPLSIYIEGDGLAWIKRTRPSGNPTPTNPVALRLAASDNISQNIIYIARPCQYTPITA
ncbi:MAG: alpha/beta hydrolase, partial [Alphaproteobacteria bacterium]